MFGGNILRFRLFWLALCGVLLIAPGPALAEWHRAESPNFVVYGEGSAAQLRQRVLLLEDYDRLLRTLSGLTAPPSPNKLHIYLVANSFGLRAIRPTGADTAGFYSASPHGIAAAAHTANWGVRGWTNQILFHEYTHHFMMQYFPGSYPAWYVEGFAEYFMTAQFEADTIEVGRHSVMRAGWVAQTRQWMSLDDLLFGDASHRNRDDVARFYAQSWLLVHYLMRDPQRLQQLRAYLRAVAGGGDQRALFAASFGTDTAGMTRALRAYAREGMTYTQYRRRSITSPPQIVMTRHDVPDAIVHAEAALRIGVRVESAPFIARVRRAAAGRSDSFTQRVLTHAEVLHGDLEAGDRMLTTLLEQAPGDAQLLYLRGMRHLMAGRREPGNRLRHNREARIWFGRAHRADDNHFQTLHRYAESLVGEPSFVSENTANVLLLARGLAPQVSEIAINAAALLLAREQYADAEVILRPIATGAHDDFRTATLAKTLLERARARERGDAAFVSDEPAVAATASPAD